MEENDQMVIITVETKDLGEIFPFSIFWRTFAVHYVQSPYRGDRSYTQAWADSCRDVANHIVAKIKPRKEIIVPPCGILIRSNKIMYEAPSGETYIIERRGEESVIRFLLQGKKENNEVLINAKALQEKEL